MNIVLFKKHIKLGTIIMLALVVFLIIYGIGAYINLKTQYLEYAEIGENYTSVFWTNLKVNAITFGISAIAIFLFIFITNIFIKKGVRKICDKEKALYVKTPNLSIALLIGIIGGFAFSNYASGTVLSFINASWFNVSDPIFFKNVGYYIFQRPMYLMLVESLSTLLIGIIVYTLAYYIVAISILLTNGISKENFRDSSFVTHNFINVVLFLLVRAWGFALNVEGLLFSDFLESNVGGKITSLIGAGFTEVNISRYVYMALPYIVGICILVAGLYIRRKKIKKAIIAIAVIPAILILNGMVTGFVNVFIVAPNELEIERQYIGNNMEYTKQGYNLDAESATYEVKNELTTEGIEKNNQLIENVRILDYKSTLKVLNQYQTIKGYYTFNDVDIAVYDVNGKKTAVFIAARELNENQLKDKTYIAKRFQYTHGYGLVVTSVNDIDSNGYPNYIIKDITSDLSNNGISIKEPRIYYGELTKEHVVVNGKNIKEFDYPNGTEEINEYQYIGDTGISLTFGNRVLMAIKYADPKLIYSQYIDNNSKLLINRDIVERAKKVAPFLEYDNDPYLVVNSDGNLVWVIDAYTTTQYYPYSQMTQIEKHYPNGIPYKKQFNYIRNSVKVIVDAYDGTTKFYIVDRDDPLIMSYYKMYPSMFENIDEGLSEEIWSHIRYPEYLYNMQSEKLLQYHVSDVDTFYRNEDVWAVTTHNNGTKEEKMEPYYGLTMLDNELQFALMQQYTPLNRNNLVSWAAISSDKEDYGKITLYTFNKDTNVIGPMQLDNQIDQNADISKDLSLWSTGGSSIIRSMTIVPINNTLLYVEPIYLAAMNESQIPAIKNIVVSNGNNLAMASTFEEALIKLINKETIQITVENTDTIDDIISTLIQTNKNMKEAANTANWEMYGKYMQKTDDLIKQLEDMQEKQQNEEE